MTTIEKTILENLMLNEEFGRKVLPYIKEEYFSNKIEKILWIGLSNGICLIVRLLRKK